MRFRLALSTWLIGSLLLTAPSVAGTKDEPPPAKDPTDNSAPDKGGEESRLSKNSFWCQASYFTNGADNLDFKGAKTKTCFDLKGGDDVLILPRTAYPDGVEIISGQGRDRVWASDGDDVVRDTDGRDAVIKTFDGDDRIEIETQIVRDPRREMTSTEPTDIFMGSGENLLRLGYAIADETLARRSPDLRIHTGQGARDRIEAQCGHHVIGDLQDITALDLPADAGLSLATQGCNLSLKGLEGNVEMRADGGQLSVQTGFAGRFQPREPGAPRLDLDMKNGRRALLDIDRIAARSRLDWTGDGPATVSLHPRKQVPLGTWKIMARRDVSVNVSGAGFAGQMVMGSLSAVRLYLETSTSEMAFSLAAPLIEIDWSPGPGAQFPSLEIAHGQMLDLRERTYPEIDWEGTTIALDKDYKLLEEPDFPINRSLPADIVRHDDNLASYPIVAGDVTLRLHPRAGFCKRLRIREDQTDRILHDVSCETASTLALSGARWLEVVAPDGGSVQIDVSEKSGARIDELVVSPR